MPSLFQANSDRGSEEIASSANSQLRQFKVVKTGAAAPQADCKGTWTAADPKTFGGFTAVGYYFAKDLQQKLHRPIALISSYYGGSNIESWLSPETLAKVPFKAAADALTEEAQTSPERQRRYEDAYKLWQSQYHREDLATDAIQAGASTYAAAEIDTADWHPVQIKGAYSEASLPANRQAQVEPADADAADP